MNAVSEMALLDDLDMTSGTVSGNPVAEIRTGAIVACLFFVGFLGWAAFARMDAAAYAPGSLVVSGQRQSVQHADGGVVAEIFIREGQRVAKGQLLMRLAAADVQAREQVLASQAIGLLARRARLHAEQLGKTSLTLPSEFASLPERDRAAADLAMTLQRSELVARASLMAAQRGTLRERIAQSNDERQGLGQQAKSFGLQMQLLDDQLAALQPVAERGFVSKTRIRELERARAALAGQRGEYLASEAQTAGAVRERQMQIVEIEQGFRERAATELREVETSLAEILPQLAAARDKVARIEIKAPTAGTLVGLSVFTPGGVITAGQKLVDIVPGDAPLRIQARISPQYADDIVVGRRALVKMAGLKERTLPDLVGTVTRLSADSLTDERTGDVYFSSEVTVPLSQLHLINDIRGNAFELRAGMPAEVLITLKRRTALDYILEPLFGALWRSFREQ